MEQYFPIMTQAYRQKHYKNGVFDEMHKNTAKVSFLTYIFMGVVLAGGAYGTWWTLCNMQGFREADLTAFGYIMAAVCAFFAIIALACIVISVRRHLRGADDWKEHCAKENGYTIADMEQFEQQALGNESYVLCLIDPVKKAVQGQEDGILTKDYIALTLNNPNILKLADISTACLLKQTVKMGKGRSRIGVDYLSIGLMAKGGASVIAECSQKSGTALIEMLKERIPNLDTADGEILESSEYDALWATKYGNNNRRTEAQ